MPVTIAMAFLWAPPDVTIGSASRIMFFHVPLAWVSVLAFIVSGVLSIMHLAVKNRGTSLHYEKAYNSAVIGFVFTIMTVISGSLWAKMNWGSYWNWDPREISIMVILLIYIAYFSLEAALSGNDKRSNIGSSYLILAMITLPFFVFIAPRIRDSLHPAMIINADMKIHLDDRMKTTLFVALCSFSILYFFIFTLMNRILVMRKKIEEHSETSD
jgi:heme exporter protein C